MTIEDTDSKKDFELRPISCPICCTDATVVLGYRGGAYQRYSQGIPTRIVQCKKCSLIYPNPFPYPRDSNLLYQNPEEYFATHDEITKVSSNCKLIDEIIMRLGRNKVDLLDVGSGRGEMLEAARLKGVETIGLDFSKAMVEYIYKRYGISIMNQTIEEFAQKSVKSFDAVILNAVLEHVYDPNSMISAARRLTRPGSVLYIDIPREPNLLTQIGNWTNWVAGSQAVYNLSPTWPPYHVFGFSERSLSALLKKHGFEIVSLRVYAGPKISSRPEWRDKIRAWIGTQVNRIANATGTASNMYVWAKRI